MEVIAENRVALEPLHRVDPRQKEWDEALSRVQAYLIACRIGDAEFVRDCAREIVNSARQVAVANGGEMQAALEKADDSLGKFLRADAQNREEILQALLFQLGIRNFAEARIPARPPETRPMTMQTSLSRLPSIRLIAGWIVLIALLFVVFLLTHR